VKSCTNGTCPIRCDAEDRQCGPMAEGDARWTSRMCSGGWPIKTILVRACTQIASVKPSPGDRDEQGCSGTRALSGPDAPNDAHLGRRTTSCARERSSRGAQDRRAVDWRGMGARRPRPVVLDAGAFITVERNDAKMRALVELALAHGSRIAELVWRRPTARRSGQPCGERRTTTASYVYDSNGNRSSKITPSGEEDGIYDAQDQDDVVRGRQLHVHAEMGR